ncbi:muscle, skeletal receptor tyrosine protein kinase-like [Ptychodera flava]|uniref:muscle, skeletal receptor tyrosine protein kinase-like n=1 Tax=Ptychodera flava TaxID=63121 RepID=UPI00396A1185
MSYEWRVLAVFLISLAQVCCSGNEVLPQSEANTTSFTTTLILQTSTTITYTEPQFSRHPSNATQHAGGKVTFRCVVSGTPEPVVSWEKDGEPLPENMQSRVNLKNGNLKLKNIEPADAGFYRCIATNEMGTTYSQTAYLTVHVPAKIIKGPQSYNVTFGTVVNLTCEATGIPTPKLFWKRNGALVYSASRTKTYDEPVLTVNVTMPLNYTCAASNDPVNMVSIYEQSDVAVITVSGKDKPAGYCNVYKGNVCAKHFGARQRVFFNNSYASDISEVRVRNLTVELLSTLDPGCRHQAEKLLCHYAFPDCDNTVPGYPMPKPLCKEECLAVQKAYCKIDWPLLEDNISQGIHLKSRGPYRLPDCYALPSMHDKTGRGLQCSASHIYEERKDLTTESCVLGKGEYYRGKVNITESGLPCQSWSSQTPNMHDYTPDVFPDLPKTENYCRNPAGEVNKPWCYTQEGKRWEYCNISHCENDTLEWTTPSVDRVTISRHSPGGNNGLVLKISIILSVVVTLLIIVAGSFVYCKCKKHRKYSMYEFPKNFDISKLPENPMYQKPIMERTLSQNLEPLEYPRNNIVYIKDVGQGAFGRVFMAKAPRVTAGQEYTIIAVKMLKSQASPVMLQAFNREALLISKFNHPNIVKLLGVCSIGRPACLLLEYMGQGDLNEFLRLRDPKQLLLNHLHPVARKLGLRLKEQLSFAQQIAAGMAYISDKKFVHRDLATRNCLVSDNMTVKISDFGLARFIGQHAHYKGTEGDAIPIRWTAPEAVIHNEFTTYSDVWSYGVLLWEIFTYALQPYYGISHTEVIRHVQSGQILQCPDNAPEEIYQFMKMCWRMLPMDRPSFSTVHSMIRQLQHKFAGQEVC